MSTKQAIVELMNAWTNAEKFVAETNPNASDEEKYQMASEIMRDQLGINERK